MGWLKSHSTQSSTHNHLLETGSQLKLSNIYILMTGVQLLYCKETFSGQEQLFIPDADLLNRLQYRC